MADTRPAAERAAADAHVRRMSDAEVLAQFTGTNFDADAYLRQNPDVAADPMWGVNPHRHWLAYGQHEGRAFPKTAAPASSPLQLTPVYEVPALPSTASIFPKVTQVAPAPASSTVQATPVATPLQQTSMFATPVTSYAPQLPVAAPAPAPLPSKSLPSWAIPAAIGAAALVAVPLLLRKKGSRHAS
jgi:hypothetical protein